MQWSLRLVESTKLVSTECTYTPRTSHLKTCRQNKPQASQGRCASALTSKSGKVLQRSMLSMRNAQQCNAAQLAKIFKFSVILPPSSPGAVLAESSSPPDHKTR